MTVKNRRRDSYFDGGIHRSARYTYNSGIAGRTMARGPVSYRPPRVYFYVGRHLQDVAMPGNDPPRLVWILIRLAQDWAVTKNRCERFDKRQRRASGAGGQNDDEGQALWDAYHDHPFPGFVRFVDHHLGFGQDAIREAALKEFNGERELVAAISALDEKGITAELFAKLLGECRGIVQRLFAAQNADGAMNGAEASTLTDLLDRARKVFALANLLGGEFKQDFDSQGPVFIAGEASPRQRHAETIKEFIAAVLDLGDAVKHPSGAFATVANQVRIAGQIAKRLSDTNSADILGLFPDLNTVAHDGYEAVKAVRNAVRPDDPFSAFVGTPTVQTAKHKEIEDDPAQTNAKNGELPQRSGDESTPKKAKRSTERGEGRAKLIAALTTHHKYADGGCLNLEPIGNNELARMAEVAKRTASAFFRKEFQGHLKYKALCNDPSRLVAALKALNGEFRPHDFYDARTPDELEQGDE